METTITQNRSGGRRGGPNDVSGPPPSPAGEVASLAPRGESTCQSGRSATGLSLHGFEILRASHLGMCFGVRDAIEFAHAAARQQPVTVLGELVHNETVLQDLSSRGVRFARQPEDATTETVLITAHGTSDRTRERLREDGFNVLESTCPLVHFAHRMLRELVAKGFHPVIIGQRDHVEVRGMTGDLAEFDVILSESDIASLRERPRFGVVSQTTQPVDRVRRLLRCLSERFPRSEVAFRDTVCQPTKQRQAAAIELAQRCDVVIVIGGANSNNTRELVATCSRYCACVHHIQHASDLRSEWFLGAGTVGLTAGTSTPDAVIDAVEHALDKFRHFQQAA